MKKIHLLILFILISGCSSEDWKPHHCDLACLNKNIHTQHAVTVRYLGVGALDIRFDGYRILTDPFYTPHSMWSLASLSDLKSDPSHITRVLGEPDASVDAVLVGHGHYDHIADLPAITAYLKPSAQILASKTSINMVHGSVHQQQLVSVNQAAEQGDWILFADGKIRVKAIASEHAPQILNINLLKGHIHQPLAESPAHVCGWKQGVNFNWLIDFLDAPQSIKDKESAIEPKRVEQIRGEQKRVEQNDTAIVAKRLFVQTSASSFPVGLPDIQDGIPVDMAILAAASFDNVENYPTGIIKQLSPKQVLMCHWENFFHPWWKNPKPMGLIDFGELSRRLNADIAEDQWFIPAPGSWYRL